MLDRLRSVGPSRLNLKRDLHTTASIGLFWALTRVYSRMGDPVGVLETTDDIPAFADSLRVEPVVRSRTGFAYSSDYEVCSAILRSPEASADVPESRNLLESILIGPALPPDRVDPLLDAIIAKDGAAHSRIRRLVQPAFTHRVMQGWREATERVAQQLVDALPTDRPFDLVHDLAAPLPMAVICEVLGVPYADREQFSAWGDTLASGLDRPRSLAHARSMEAAAEGLTDYLADLLAERRKNPADDLLSSMAQAEIDGDRLDDRDIIGTASFLLLAGFETTVNLLGAGTEVLMRHPDQFTEVLANPELIPNMVEEALRYVTPVQYTFRTALAPIELPGGDVLDERETIVVMLVGANRDPRVFTDPYAFDIHRDNARKHLAFGFGIHHCLGAALARMEAEVAWRTLFARFPDPAGWHIAGEPVPNTGRMIHGLRSLPVRLGAPVHA
ncbi:MAG: cytochrome [Actinomycetota bacterium]|jgi:cytochrome P450